MVSSIITQVVNTVPVLTPYDGKRAPLPELGEGATVVITARYWGNRKLTASARIERIKPYKSEVRPGVFYRDALFGLRMEDGGYKVMFGAELRKRLIAYAWKVRS